MLFRSVSVTPEYAMNGSAAIVPFLPARDHKRLLDGAKGPNTGGMGAVCPLDDVTDKMMKEFNKDILEPTLNGLIKEKYDYRGFIFFGVMLTKNDWSSDVCSSDLQKMVQNCWNIMYALEILKLRRFCL